MEDARKENNFVYIGNVKPPHVRISPHLLDLEEAFLVHEPSLFHLFRLKRRCVLQFGVALIIYLSESPPILNKNTY